MLKAPSTVGYAAAATLELATAAVAGATYNTYECLIVQTKPDTRD